MSSAPAIFVALAHQAGEAAEQIVAVARAGRGLRVVLHREHRPVLQREAAVRAVEQRDVRLLDIRRQRLLVDREAVVHRGDLDLAGGQVLHRMVRAVMALMHLHRLAAEREAEHLVAEADAEGRRAGVDHLPDHRHRVFAGRRRIARAVRQEHAVRLHRQDVFGRRRRRHDRHLAGGLGEQAQDVALDAVVDRDDMEFAVLLRGRSLRPASTAVSSQVKRWPLVTIGTRSMPSRPGHSRASFFSASRSNLPSGACAITAFGMPFWRIRLVSARVSMPDEPDDAAALEPLIEMRASRASSTAR